MERAVPVLPADDLATAKAFYVDALGFSVLFEESPDGKRGIMGLQRGTLYLTIDAPMSGHGRDACVSLLVDSADSYYEEWRQRVVIERAPKDEGNTPSSLSGQSRTELVAGTPSSRCSSRLVRS